MEPLPSWENWMVPVPEVMLYGDAFRRNFENHGHCGLKNLGNTCFLNSSVQTLIHVPVFTNWLMGDMYHYKKCNNRPGNICFTCILSNTFRNMLGGCTSVVPGELCVVLEVLGLKWGMQEDANDFLLSLLGTMTEEYLMRYPEMEAVLDYCSKHTTAIDMLFGFWAKSKVTCGVCQFKSTTYSLILEV